MNNIEQLQVTRKQSLKDALEVLDRGGKTIVLLVDDDGKLQRTITDGDIRRLLISGSSLEDSLECMENKSAITAGCDISPSEALELMDLHEIDHIPLIDSSNKPVELLLRRDMQPYIQLSIPHMGSQELKFVQEAFDTNWIAPLGPNVDAFEIELADYVGAQYAAALSSGTAALHLAMRLLDVGPGDLVLCSSFTFVASANPILYQGGTPVFIDSEPASWNMSPAALERALQDAASKGVKPKAIIVTHLYGQSANMQKIMSLANRYDVPVVEDAAESLGGLHQGKHTGTFAKFGVFSFNGNKIITTSGGGMLVSDDRELIERARFLSTQAKESEPFYEHKEVGYNYRMSNVLAGIGRGQLKVLDNRVEARRGIFSRYREGLRELDQINWMPEPEGDFSNRWLSVLSIDPHKTDLKPRDVMDNLAQANIEARHVWKPMHMQPLFRDCQFYRHDDDCYSEYLFNTSICMPSASIMTAEQQETVIRRLIELSWDG